MFYLIKTEALKNFYINLLDFFIIMLDNNICLILKKMVY